MLVYEVKHFSLVNISIGSFMKVHFSVATNLKYLATKKPLAYCTEYSSFEIFGVYFTTVR